MSVVNLQLSGFDYVTEKFDRVAEKSAVLNLQGDASLSESGEDFVDMTNVAIQSFGEDYDIVEIDETRLPLETGEDDIERSLECGRCVSETERHVDVLKLAGVAHKGGFVTVFFNDGRLPITVKGIEGGKDARFAEGVDTFVHVGKRVGILDGHGVQMSVIDTEAQLSVLFGCKKHRSGPF